MFSMGIHSFIDLAKEAKAVYRIRRIVLVNTETLCLLQEDESHPGAGL